MQFCREDAGIVLCCQHICVLREIRSVALRYRNFKIVDPEGKGLSSNQNGWPGCFLQCVEKYWKVARLETIVAGDHDLTRHVNDAEFDGINLCYKLGACYRIYGRQVTG